MGATIESIIENNIAEIIVTTLALTKFLSTASTAGSFKLFNTFNTPWAKSPKLSPTNRLSSSSISNLLFDVSLMQNFLPGVAGLEPTTYGFGDRCSTKLSYTPIHKIVFYYKPKINTFTGLLFGNCQKFCEHP